MSFPPTVLDDWATIQRIVEGRLSFARLGDGEYRLAGGHGTKTQMHHPELARRLRQILKEPDSRVLIGILDLYSNKPVGQPWPSRAETTRRYGTPGWAVKYLHPEATYGCASVTRLCNWSLGDRQAWQRLVSRIWADRDVLVVAGSSKGLAAKRMVLDEARSVGTLELGCQVDAWQRYPFVLSYCRMAAEGVANALVMAALGATATVLAHELAGHGIQALDIGHLPQSLRGINPKTLPEP